MIGINYTYHKKENKIILKNYLLVFGICSKIINKESELLPEATDQIIDFISKTPTRKLKSILHKAPEEIFENTFAKKILEVAYDYEIQQKFFQKKVKSRAIKNKRLEILFSKIYGSSIREIELKKYLRSNQELKRILSQESNNIKEDIEKFLKQIYMLLEETGYKKELKEIQETLKEHKINISNDKNNSSFVSIKENQIYININNNKKVSIYHEATHLIQRIIKKIYNISINDSSLIERNEGLANFIAYNMFDYIEHGNKELILHHIYFPKYSYIYKTLQKKGGKSPKENKEIVYKVCKELGYKNESEIENIYYRLFKFYPLNQNKYFYPKELAYQKGYETIIEILQKDKRIHKIIELLLYKDFIS